MGQRLASLVVDLQLQSAELRKGLDEANKKIDAFAKNAKSASDTLIAGFTFEAVKGGITRLAEFVKGGADAADAMGRLATAVGIPVDGFSKLAYAAEQSGVSSEQLGQGLGKLSKLMEDAHNGGAEQAAIFRGLGIAVEDASGKLRSSGDVLRDISQRFAGTQDGSAKTAIALQLFGESGAKLIPLLDQGASGLDTFGAAAERTGRVVTNEGAEAAKRFNQALARLEGTGTALATRVTQDLGPSLSALADDLTTSKNSAEAFKTIADELAFTIRALASAGVLAAAVVQDMGVVFAGIGSSVTSLVHGGFQAEAESAAATHAAQVEVFAEAQKRLSAIWETSGPGAAMAKDAEKAKPSADKYVDAIERAKKASENAVSALKAQLELQRKLLDIDREMAKRRAESDGESPTKGFANLEEAQQTFEQLRKWEAMLRANASAMGDRASRAKPNERAGLLRAAESDTRQADDTKDLGDRAERAMKAFEDMAKAAGDASARAMDEEAAARSALDKRFEDIDKDAQKKRDESSGVPVTKGFTGFNDALDAMTRELKAQAEEQAKAASLERDTAQAKARMAALTADGKDVSPEEAAHLAALIAEAHQATLAAEAHGVLAERATSASDAFKDLVLAAQQVPQQLLGMLKPSGAATSAMMQGAETGAAAGPVGAVVGGLVGLLSQSKTFQFAMQELEDIFQKLANSVGKLVEPLLPLLEVVADVADGFGALFEVLSPVVEFVARPLFYVFQGFGIAVLELVKTIGDIINSFAHLFGSKGFDLSGIDKALFKLENASYDSALAQQKVAEAATKVSEGLENVPAIYKTELARFTAQDPGTPGSGSTVVNDNSNTVIQLNGLPPNPEEIADIVLLQLEAEKQRRSGNRFGDENP